MLPERSTTSRSSAGVSLLTSKVSGWGVEQSLDGGVLGVAVAGGGVSPDGATKISSPQLRARQRAARVSSISGSLALRDIFMRGELRRIATNLNYP